MRLALGLLADFFNSPKPYPLPTPGVLMSSIVSAIRQNPVRVMSTLSAVVALVAFYFPTLPVALILAIPAALLGIGEVTRAKVTPNARVALHVDQVPEGSVALVVPQTTYPGIQLPPPSAGR